ncbi:SAM-dependent methyltransferase [Deinobacterium chartae]|uniref:SAM-dependent methyltransferase n=1 Tax=Deinobacterium chartae TaxID=521158 RepID=A0A841HYJ6_9DEIO|nr:class I SAM-dependent methyltransferase [Deinobacterium chartae]MBB6098467.1 SAM-dependent methyltransferase [Deinobacterium chartae]
MPSSRSSRRAVTTAWESSDWYLGMVGRRGHLYHRHLALPALLALLEPQPGERLLDVGCGPGVPAPHLARLGVHYTGLDASPRMIAQARKHHARSGTFVVGDARHLRAAVGQNATFDAVSFVFSLQDMHPLEQVLSEAAGVLRPGGRLVAVLTHPCFRVPRQSGWGWDACRKLAYRRVDRYLSPLCVPARRAGGAGTLSFHRPLQDYVAALFAAGMTLEALRELAPTDAMRRQLGRSAAPDNPDIPALLALRARRATG